MSTKAVTTRIQHKHDLEANWLKAVNFVPMQGELIIYDAEVDANGQTLALPTGRTTPYTYERFKIGDGKTTVSNLNYAVSSEADLKLVEDLYTYTAIGKITGASNTNPVKVASAGENLKTVFNTVFGVQQDQQPVINIDNVKLTVVGSPDNYGGGEYGTKVSAATLEINCKLSNSGTASYGYRHHTTKVPGEQTIYYPIDKISVPGHATHESEFLADVAIFLPDGQTASSDMVTTPDMGKDANGNSIPACVACVDNVLYCNFNTKKYVRLNINLPAGSVTTSEQVRYGQIQASVQFSRAHKEDRLVTDYGTAISAFLTYLGNDADATVFYEGEGENAITDMWHIKRGYKYTYYAVTSDTTTPTSWTRYAANTNVTDLTINADAGQYIWIASASNYSNIYEFNEVSSKYNTDATPTTKTSGNTLKNSQGVYVPGYYFYRITNPRAVSGSSKFKLA